MNAFLNKILGLDGIGFGSPGTEFVFLHPFGAWAWVLAAMALGVLCWWSYRGLTGSRPTRSVLGVSRGVLVILLLVLASGPMLERITMHTERDTVLVMLDRSGSLNTPDKNGRTRQVQLADILRESGDDWAALSEAKQVSWYGFNDRASLLTQGPVPTQMPEIGGKGSGIGAALSSALDEHRGQPIAGIVVVSDGQSTDTIGPGLITDLSNRSIGVFAVPLGSPEPIRDLSISRVQAPGLVFADDRTPVRVDLSWSGIDASAGAIDIELIDHATGEVVASQRVDPGDFDDHSTSQVTLLHSLDTPGESRIDIVINTGANADLNPENNRSSITLEVVDRPLRVLYVDGYPRWEQRYLKNMLSREGSIESTSMLLASDRRYKQDGDVIIDYLPTTKEQWSPYDVIILGDVRAELFTPEQIHGLLDHIADHGAGLLWIGGPSATPSSWLDSPAAGLLPMRQPAQDRPAIRGWNQPVTLSSTHEADRLGILQLGHAGWEPRLTDPDTGWSQLHLVQQIDFDTLKPGASVLATAHPIDQSAGSSAAVITMRYGGGQVGYVGTDEIWRWRYGRGEDLPERFWLPMIRMLARGAIARGSAPALLRASPSLPEPGKPVQVVTELLDQALVDTIPELIEAKITRIGSKDTPDQAVLQGRDRTRLGTWVPIESGQYQISLDSTDPLLASVSTTVTVLEHSDERRTLDTNHPFLADLAEQTGGGLIPADEFAQIPSMLPNRARTISLPPERVPLWDRPVALLMLILLVSVEWAGRKFLRLA